MYENGYSKYQKNRSFRYLWITGIENLKNKNYGKTLVAAGERLCDYLSDYQCLFENKTKSNFDIAQLYTKGIVLSELNNIERINETLDGPMSRHKSKKL